MCVYVNVRFTRKGGIDERVKLKSPSLIDL